MKLLHVDSSILGEASASRALTSEVVQAWRETNPNLQVTYRDLAADPVSHVSGAYLAAHAVDPAQHGPELRQDLAASGAALDEFLSADVVVIGAPMYNFTIPTQLKAWIDRLAVAGKTFRYTATGSEGLAGDKTVIVVSTRGGFYGEGSPLAAIDHQEPYLRAIFGFFGITKVEFIRAEGLAVGPEQRQQGIAAARQSIGLALAA